MESPQKCSSFKNLVGTIESLLGSKSDFTVTWAQHVKLIAEDLSNSCPSTPCTPLFVPEPAVYDGEKVALEGKLILLKAAYALSNVHRKIALNNLLDLKGNIRVFCRVRPPLVEEREPRAGFITSSVPNEVQVSSCSKTRGYKFDKVFLPTSLQDDVFSEVEPVIRSAMDGSNVCIFAYGQTGTGKTFTMEGTQDAPGVVPRTLQQVFFDASRDTLVEYSFKLSMLEVYRGSLRDLLLPRNHMKDHHSKSLCIQMGGQGSMEIENLIEVPIHNASQAGYLYRKGMRARSTSWTTANGTSSRSHCLVRITITCNHGKVGQKHVSKLWLVDLGGSERFFKTQAQGQTLEEGKAINASLSALGDVISALQRKQAHIPYRNSKLTQILRDCLGKNSKALMLVHVSPKEEDMGETLCSLGFASRARGIHLDRDVSCNGKDERAATIAEMLQKTRMYENECQKLNDNIRMIESVINSKTQTFCSELQIATTTEATEGAREEESSDNKDRTPVAVPRFMKPTMSSESKKRVNVVHESVVSVTMEAKTVKETMQVRRALNFEVTETEAEANESSSKETTRASHQARRAWNEIGKKKHGRRRWTLECSNRISIKRF